MKYYHKYQEALEAAGYRVDEHGYVWDSMGNQSAGEETTVTYKVKTLT